VDSEIKNFNIGDLSIPYELINNDKAKNIRVSMSIEGMRVSKPNRVKLNEVENFLKAKANWIKKLYIKFQSIKVDKNERKWQSGEIMQYMGSSYNISVLKYDGLKKTIVEFTGTQFVVYVNKILSDEQKKISIENQFKKWFIRMTKETIEERLEFYCNKVGLSYNQVRIKEQKTRWGSCSKNGNLNFNWKLIMAPQWVMDYVVLHEICHLRYLNHSKEFWNLVGVYMPEYKKAQQWLKKNGIGLNI
jgi:hypothetical protein